MTRSLRTLPAVLSLTPLLALAPLLAACGSSGSSGSSGGGTSVAAQGSGDAQTVTVKGNQQLQFEPKTVTATVGTLRLTFALDGSTPHNLEFKDAGVGPAIPTVTGAPVTGTFTFAKPGTYTFVCTLHPGMDGKVVVS